MFTDDYIERLIEQIATLLADMAGFQKTGDDRSVLDEADRGYDMLLGPQRQFLDMVDGASLARFIGGEPRRVRALAEVCHREGQALQSMGNVAKAKRRYLQAIALYGAVVDERVPADDEAVAQIRERLAAAG